MIFLKMVMMRMETYKTNFKKAYIKANEILVSSCVLAEFPVKAKKIIESNDNMKCCSYKKALKIHGLNIEDFGSKSAVLIKCENKNIIFYNESELKARIRFSILHEFGHYKLRHDLDVNNIDTYKAYELETNYFAAQLLMPEQLIRELQRRGMKINEKKLIELFGVSEEAAKKRMVTLNKNLMLSKDEKYFDDLIVEKYKDWLNSKIPSINTYNVFYDDEEKQKERESWLYN